MQKYVLLVDDDEGILDVSTIILNERGYKVEQMMDPEGIYKRIKKDPPGVILLDLWMPQLSGEEILQNLKNNKRTSSIPVIVVSASKDTEVISKRLGADGYINKPFDITELEKVVSKYIDSV